MWGRGREGCKRILSLSTIVIDFTFDAVGNGAHKF